MAELFRKKYVKQTIFIVGFILFLLSLFEWTDDRKFFPKAESTSASQFVTTSIKDGKIAGRRQVKNILVVGNTHRKYQSAYISPHNHIQYYYSQRKFMLIRSLRIWYLLVNITNATSCIPTNRLSLFYGQSNLKNEISYYSIFFTASS